MKYSDVTIRLATAEDSARLLEIYAPYVLTTAISFEYDVPTIEEFAARMRDIQRFYPYIVAEAEGRILGYAYAGRFSKRRAYDWAVETTVYVAQDVRHSGVGKKLYGALESILKKMHVCNAYACIAFSENEDEHLTRNSVDFHARAGYATVGEFRRCGYKFGRWYNIVWMEKTLTAHPDDPPAVLSVHDLQNPL